MLGYTNRFGLLRRKEDLLDDGVAAVFGLASGEAELLALSFHAEKFTPARAATWLAERGINPLLFATNTDTDGPKRKTGWRNMQTLADFTTLVTDVEKGLYATCFNDRSAAVKQLVDDICATSWETANEREAAQRLVARLENL